jgi:riboflavin kinase/FMN adenylyltransferase
LETFRGASALPAPLARSILTVGNFDGVHLGHRAILDTVTARARANAGPAVVYSFDPHPRSVLHPERAPGLLTTLDQKSELLAAAGIDVLIVEPFTREFAQMPPERFVRDWLHARVAPKEVYVGYDFHFGRDRLGSMQMLTELGPKLGFSVTIIPEVTVRGADLNSTRIRELLHGGEVEEAAALLGRPYAVRAEVIRGAQRGRTLGFATANLEAPNVLPAAGVYAGWARRIGTGAESRPLPAVANVGVRPTFENAARVLLEVHLLDFAGDLYAEHLEFSFLQRLRAERRFEGPDALRAQIARDIAAARERLFG